MGAMKMNDKFHQNSGNTDKILKLSCVRCNFVKFGILFLGSNKKFSLVILQMTNYILSP